jgi:hypothetical protein
MSTLGPFFFLLFSVNQIYERFYFSFLAILTNFSKSILPIFVEFFFLYLTIYFTSCNLIHGFFLYMIIFLYSWSVSLLKDIEKCIRNFIWIGDIEKSKLVTIAWKNICRPLSQGGLNLRSLITLNKASDLKLCWSLFNSQSCWLNC